MCPTWSTRWWPTGSAATSVWRPRWPARGDGTVDELLPEVYGDVTERQLPVARFSLWAHLRALGQEGRARALDAPPGQDVIETRWAATA